MKRVSRACLHCRQRKSKCDLYVPLIGLTSLIYSLLAHSGKGEY